MRGLCRKLCQGGEGGAAGLFFPERAAAGGVGAAGQRLGQGAVAGDMGGERVRGGVFDPVQQRSEPCGPGDKVGLRTLFGPGAQGRAGREGRTLAAQVQFQRAGGEDVRAAPCAAMGQRVFQQRDQGGGGQPAPEEIGDMAQVAAGG